MAESFSVRFLNKTSRKSFSSFVSRIVNISFKQFFFVNSWDAIFSSINFDRAWKILKLIATYLEVQ